MNRMLASFITESRELLEAASRCFLQLESAPLNQELLNELFRAVHTIKGSSALFDIKPLTLVVHAAEDILDLIRVGELVLTTEMVDLFLESLDQVGIWIDELESSETLGSDAVAISEAICRPLHTIFQHATADTAQVKQEIAVAESSPGQLLQHQPQWWNSLTDVARSRINEVVKDITAPVEALEYCPKEDCFFSGEDPFYTFKQLPGLLWISIDTCEPFANLDEIDPYHCILRFRAISSANRSELTEYLRYIVDQVGFHTFSIPAEKMSSLATNATEMSASSLTQASIELLQTQYKILSLPCAESLWSGRLISVSTTIERILIHEKQHEHLAELQRVALLAAERAEAGPLKEFISQLLQPVQESASVSDTATAAEEVSELQAAPELQEEDASKAREAKRSNGLRVDQERIDELMDLVGELVVSKNALPFLAKRAEEEFGCKELARELKNQYATINRISNEMQYSVMQIRMVAVSTVFQRFPRMVRDLARKLDKQIRLTVQGEETEADKNVVEDLAEPLIHLIRNSCDHGIEMSDIRAAAGKPVEGEIILRAVHLDDRVVIEVKDDGGGLDPEKLKRKAYAKGLLDEEHLNTMSDKDALQLIFAPGFSTAEAITEVSGRGVGMDAVRAMVLRVGGNITLDSKVGEGTTIQLTLPLSMAVTQVMMVEVDGERFGVPVDMITATARVKRAELKKIRQHDMVVLRDQLIPICRLASALNISQGHVERDDIALLVVKVKGESLALEVDRFYASIDIILKPLEGILSGFDHYTGTALLGDGHVLLVLNLRRLAADIMRRNERLAEQSVSGLVPEKSVDAIRESYVH